MGTGNHLWDSWTPGSTGRSVVTACLVAGPLATGIGFGHDAAGATATLGAYLWTVSHLTVGRPIGIRVAAVAAVLLGVAGVTGALAGGHLWLLVVLTVVWASCQAVAEIAGTALRMPVAMSALCFLLSAIGGAVSPRAALWRGLLVLGGAAWAALCELARNPPWRSPGEGSRTIGLAELWAARVRSRGFALLLSAPTALSAGLVGLSKISHGAWMATTVLRVARPEVSATLARSGRRIAGTTAGALIAAVLLGTERHELTAVIVVVVCVSGMQLVGPAHYGFYTFFLTLLALELVSVDQAASWHLALLRVALTLAGVAVAVASGFLYDRASRSGVQNGQRLTVTGSGQYEDSRAGPAGGVAQVSQRDERAGQPAAQADLVDVARLITAFYAQHPDPGEPGQRVVFGTSGHRGSALRLSFNEDHIAATTQAICDYRADAGITGPLFIGRDTHALSEPALVTALEVLAANGVTVLADSRDGYTPTPAVSLAILVHNDGRRDGLADGIVVTPSHNPPEDGGFKYNPPDGGPAGTQITSVVQDRANQLLRDGLKQVSRIRYDRARAVTGGHDFLGQYVSALPSVVDLDAVRSAGVRIGADPLGGASVAYWGEIAAQYGLDLTVVNPVVDATFRFMTLDWDGRIRMDCSSPYAMASLIERRADFAIATGNDTDADRHGIVTPQAGLLNPNHYLAAAIEYLYSHRENWPADTAVGKTMVSSSIIDRVAQAAGRRLMEVPVGFKWFVPGLLDGTVAFGGEESAGASFLRRDGRIWTTDKDGIILALLASEITAVTGQTPGERYRELTERLGAPVYQRIDAPATREQKAALARLSPDQVDVAELAGEKVLARLTTAPGNGEPLGGLKVITESGWFAARPSGTEDVYKLYAESFQGADHLARIQAEAQQIIESVLRG